MNRKPWTISQDGYASRTSNLMVREWFFGTFRKYIIYTFRCLSVQPCNVDELGTCTHDLVYSRQHSIGILNCVTLHTRSGVYLATVYVRFTKCDALLLLLLHYTIIMYSTFSPSRDRVGRNLKTARVRAESLSTRRIYHI